MNTVVPVFERRELKTKCCWLFLSFVSTNEARLCPREPSASRTCRCCKFIRPVVNPGASLTEIWSGNIYTRTPARIRRKGCALISGSLLHNNLQNLQSIHTYKLISPSAHRWSFLYYHNYFRLYV